MTKNEMEKLKSFISAKCGLDIQFGGYSKLYNMTTENIHGFLSTQNLKGKRVLTVAGSGDQRLTSYLLGASDVICFDINPLVEFQLDLKDTAIKELSFEEFIRFFGLNNKKNIGDGFLHPMIFDKLKYLLDKDTNAFFDFIINDFPYNPRNKIYFGFEDQLSLLKNMNGYLDKSSYNRLASILDDKRIDFVNANVDNLPDILNGEKFDVILLSNISDYIHDIYPNNELERFRELIDRLMDNLNLYGVMQVGYIYSKYYRGENVSKFHYKDSRHKYFPTNMFYSLLVNSYYNDGSFDKIITYQKLK